MKQLIFILPLAAMLGACAVLDLELPEENATGADEMKRSPCACVELEYDTDFIRPRTS